MPSGVNASASDMMNVSCSRFKRRIKILRKLIPYRSFFRIAMKNSIINPICFFIRTMTYNSALEAIVLRINCSCKEKNIIGNRCRSVVFKTFKK
jgi:hypothetical protein